jgi:hypothetical protein
MRRYEYHNSKMQRRGAAGFHASASGSWAEADITIRVAAPRVLTLSGHRPFRERLALHQRTTEIPDIDLWINKLADRPREMAASHPAADTSSASESTS